MTTRFAGRLALTGLLTLLAWAPGAFAQQSPGAENSTDFTSESFQDWEVRCPSSGQGECSMTQLVTNAGDDQPVMRVVLSYPPQLEGPAITFLLPLGVRLAPGLQLGIDGSEAAQFPYQVCLPQGCRADLPLQPSLMSQLRGGSNATLSLFGPRGNRMDLDISLMGFTGADQRISP